MQKKDSVQVLLGLYDEFRNSGKCRKSFPGIFELSLGREPGCEYVFDASICEIGERDRVFMLGFVENDSSRVKADHALVYGTMCTIQISQHYGKSREECDCSRFDITALSDKRLRQIIFPIFSLNKDYLIGSFEGHLFTRDGLSYRNHEWIPKDTAVDPGYDGDKFYNENSVEFLKTHVRKTISRAFQESEMA